MAKFDEKTDFTVELCSDVPFPDEDDDLESVSGDVSIEKHNLSKTTADSQQWPVRRVLIAPFICLLSVPLIVSLSMTEQSRSRLTTGYGCDAGSNLWIDGVKSKSTSSIWDIVHPLDVSVAFGRLTLTEARMIDVSWDLLVGRGFQAVVGILVYRGFRLVIADALMDQPLTPKELLAVQYATASLSSLLTYIRGCWQTRLTQSRIGFHRFALLIVTVSYVLSLPTWLSAMTAYQTLLEPWLVYHNESIWFSDMTPCAVSITDGGRVKGLQNNTCVSAGSALWDAVKNYAGDANVHQCYPHGNDHTSQHQNKVGRPIIHYGHPNFPQREECNLPSRFEWPPGNIIELSAPVLDIEAGSYSYSNANTGLNKTFTGYYLIEHARCQLKGDLYSWGFSFILLFTFALTTLILSILWSFVVFKYHTRIRPDQVDMVFEDLRTALVVARSFEDETGRGIERSLECGHPSAFSIPDLMVTGNHVGANFIDRPKADPPSKHVTNYDIHSEGYEAYIRNRDDCGSTTKGKVSHYEN